MFHAGITRNSGPWYDPDFPRLADGISIKLSSSRQHDHRSTPPYLAPTSQRPDMHFPTASLFTAALAAGGVGASYASQNRLTRRQGGWWEEDKCHATMDGTVEEEVHCGCYAIRGTIILAVTLEVAFR